MSKGFKRIERLEPRRFVNEFGNAVVVAVQGGNCTGMGNPRANETVSYMIEGPRTSTVNTISIMEAEALHALLGEVLGRERAA